MYNKVRVDSWVPQLEKVLEETWLKWVDLTKEHATCKAKKVPELKVDVAKLQKVIFELHITHQVKIEDSTVSTQRR